MIRPNKTEHEAVNYLLRGEDIPFDKGRILVSAYDYECQERERLEALVAGLEGKRKALQQTCKGLEQERLEEETRAEKAEAQVTELEEELANVRATRVKEIQRLKARVTRLEGEKYKFAMKVKRVGEVIDGGYEKRPECDCLQNEDCIACYDESLWTALENDDE